MKRETNETIGTYSPTMEFFGRNKRTGELKEYGEIEILAKRKRQNTGFYMVWIEQIRPKDTKTKLLLFLIRKMSNKGTILVTNDVLAKKLEVSDKTIRTTKKQMEEERFIKYKSGRIYINPNFIWRGTPKGREEAEKIFLSVNCEKEDISIYA